MINFDIPFGNSVFQIQKFIANEITPERAVRSILLQLDQKKRALVEYEFNQKKNDIRRREILAKLNKKTGFEKERLQIELKEIKYNIESQKKLLFDCLVEVKTYEELLLKIMPNGCTREQFEEAELDYWQNRLINDAKTEFQTMGTVDKGTLHSLNKIGITISRKDNQITFHGLNVIENGNQDKHQITN